MPKAPKQKMKFRLLAGLHVEPQGIPPVGREGDAGYKPPSDDYIEGGVTYDAQGKAGKAVVESTSDLVAKFGAEKFQRLDSDPRRPDEFKAGKTGQEDDAPQGHGANEPVVSTLDKGEPQEEPEEDDLDSKTVAELREIAEEREVDLSGAHRKDEIVARLRGE